ncbi:3-deoxy-7-phosphoheptulonate synthase [Actinokineospora enzanensis]|uniref:3-deoxy-7-phosphoheptulonate synthase n=1 Tax=Actinokineospora enzanensis TaxID=155975 RepID=UPI000376CC8A|nr:3-deoxy-7-phosphoheptulonate synthase [Actinokineospora enzanensis]
MSGALATAATWAAAPAAQQPLWRAHPAYADARRTLERADPLIDPADLEALREALARVATGQARVIQAGDCAESFYECTAEHVGARLDVVDALADRLHERTDVPVLRIGRLGGQFAKPRSKPTERHGDRTIQSFRGHLVNSEVPTRAARQHDPRRMLWAYEAAGRVLDVLNRRRTGHWGPWSSHEALVLDYESALLRDGDTGPYLASTHLPWIGERTRQPDHAHVRLLASVRNPVGCKVGPTAPPEEVVRLCGLLDPDREPGRLVLISRMGRDRVEDALPCIVSAVRRAGHPVVWLCDPMHGNTITTSTGVKTRHLDALVAEAAAFHRVLARQGVPAGGLHLETAGDDVTECLGGPVGSEADLATRYTSLCDPRLTRAQGIELIDRCL